MEGKALKTHPRIPVPSGLVAIDICIPLMVVVLFNPHQHVIPHECLNPATMSIIGRTGIGKRPVIPILVTIHTFPGSVGVIVQRISYLYSRFQKLECHRFIGEGKGRTCRTSHL